MPRGIDAKSVTEITESILAPMAGEESSSLRTVVSIRNTGAGKNQTATIQSHPSPEFLNSLSFIKKFYPTSRWGEGKVTKVTYDDNCNSRQYEQQQSLSVVIPSDSDGIQPINNSTKLKGENLNNLTETVHSPFTTHHSLKKSAFTLAEVLITFGIIGVVAALTLPTVIQNYQKKVTVERLKKTYSTLAQAVQMAVKDNDDIEGWNFDLVAKDFMDKYLIPYVKDIKSKNERVAEGQSAQRYVLADGTTIRAWSWKNPEIKPFFMLLVDINGDKSPNVFGKDIFIFHIFSQEASRYNAGSGDVAKNVPKGGLYPDGYGYSRDAMLNDRWRGCNKRGEKTMNNGVETNNAGGAFCTALILYDGWQIKEDYKW